MTYVFILMMLSTPQKWSEWLSNTNLFKLTYKGKLKSKTSDGQITNYGYLLHNF